MTHSVAILGASGYTGAELVRIIATHPGLRIAALSADRKAGQQMADVFPHLRHLDLPVLTTIEEIDFSGIDLVFAALPHGLSQALVRDLPASVKVVDLGADFRLRDPAEYEKWYGAPHVATELQKTAVYGLTEFYRDDIRGARLVAGTGCNAATVQFALRPLISEKLVDLESIICDLKNGISGAGRSLKENMLFAERSTDVAGYSQGGKHRHLGEFDQEFSLLAGRPVRIVFTPHLVPVNRGILASCYLRGDPRAMHAALADALCGRALHPCHALWPAAGDGHGAGVELLPDRRDRRPGRGPRAGGLDAGQPQQGLVGAGGAERQPDAGA